MASIVSDGAIRVARGYQTPNYFPLGLGVSTSEPGGAEDPTPLV